MNFADNLKRICTERGTSHTALLKSMGVATSKVAMWNSGSLPKQEMLIRLAKELDCSVMDFFADDADLAAQNINKTNADAEPNRANPNHLFFFVKHTFGFVFQPTHPARGATLACLTLWRMTI